MPTVFTLLHYNLQYCAGGLPDLFPEYEATNDQLEDDIVEESFQPVLDVLEAHPGWTFDLELQAYMIEVMAARHPATLDQLRRLAQSGQVELVSFHYSDTLWTAFPLLDAQRSAELTRAVFEEHDLPLSRVVFTQEGQVSEGMLARMPEWGWDIAVMPPNLAEFWWGTPTSQVYGYGDTRVLLGTGLSADVGFSFLNDGELWATDGLNCYLGPSFVYDADATADRVADLEAYQAAGYTVGGIQAWVDAYGGEIAELPPILDGTWQPDDTDDLGLWMGGRGQLWPDGEADNDVRVANTVARHAVAAAEVAGGDATLVEAAWKEALLGEVSDASGWNPYWTETQYGFDHAATAEALATEAIADVCGDAGSLLVDLQTGDVEPDGEIVETAELADPDSDVPAPALTGRAGTTTWSRDGDAWIVDIDFEAGDASPVVSLPWDGAAYETIPALGDTLVRVEADDIVARAFSLPLPLGLARLDDDWFVVKDTRSLHLGAHFDRDAGTLTFQDDTGSQEALHWRIALVPVASAEAWARRWNETPLVSLPCPEIEKSVTDPGGCGCAQGAGVTWLGLVALFGLRRRS